MGNTVRQTIQGNTQHRRSGFTLVEVLVALFVIGTATTIFISMFTSSLSMASTSKSNDVAANIAEEYMNELRVHPELFNWPDFEGAPAESGMYPIALKDKGIESIFLVAPSNAEAPDERVYDRDRVLYRGYGWNAAARLSDDTANYVEIMVCITWLDGGVNQSLCLTSLLPRSVGEGVG